MPENTNCPRCQVSFQFKTEQAGRKVKCPVCDAVVQLPASSKHLPTPTPIGSMPRIQFSSGRGRPRFWALPLLALMFRLLGGLMALGVGYLVYVIVRDGEASPRLVVALTAFALSFFALTSFLIAEMDRGLR